MALHTLLVLTVLLYQYVLWLHTTVHAYPGYMVVSSHGRRILQAATPTASTATPSPPINGTYSVCPAGNSFSTTFALPDLNDTQNNTLQVVAACRQPAGSNTWNGTLNITNNQTGNYVTGSCVSILVNASTDNLYIANTNQDAFVITSCYNATNRTTVPITTTQNYTLASGLTLPAGYQSNAATLSYMVIANFYNNGNNASGQMTFVSLTDAGWYDVTVGAYTGDPDPVNDQEWLSNCLGVFSPYQFDYISLCDYSQCVQDNSIDSCDGSPASACNVTMCPALASASA